MHFNNQPMHPLDQFRYCPKCGVEDFNIRNSKAKYCPACGFVFYFNPSAAAVAFILNHKNELLIARRAKEPAKGTWDLPGGFIDPAETGEEGIRREVLEETGMMAGGVVYQFSLHNVYEYAGFTYQTLDLFYFCQVKDCDHFKADDDVADLFFLPLDAIDPEKFGLMSIRKGMEIFLNKFRKA
ncbi:MAG: NUDIX domain-containing protein [Bacteroides sp.]|nr:NUDIX domain-containing protein [Bacteroides sp.]